MTSQERSFAEFAEFVTTLKGDEKSEAQTFLLHLLEAFCNDSNTLPAGSTFEYRVRFPGQKTKFADFVWPGRVLIEMKSRGAKLARHYQQTFDYWINLTPNRPSYVVLCNFDEFWIYDFNVQLHEPVDRVKVAELPKRHESLKFLFPVYNPKIPPVFGNNWVEVTRDAANNVAQVFNELVARGELPDRARRFVLQSVVAMFSEDIGLLPDNLFTSLLDECRRGASSYDLIGSLFRQMNEPQPARGGRYAGVDYFNGGLFAVVEPIELLSREIELLLEASKEDWSRVQPVIFGTLFEGSLGKKERHALGAHFTYEADIQKIVRPSIVQPWQQRIAAAKTAKDLRQALADLRGFRILDPACGSGNFLYVAFRALRVLEQNILFRLATEFKDQIADLSLASRVSPRQFFGLDLNPVGVEVAKVTLMLARRLATREAEDFWEDHRDAIPGGDTSVLHFDKDLPLDNLDANIQCADALFTDWPACHAIIGNPPFQSKNKMQQEFGPAYVQKVRAAYPGVPGRADFCVYWFRKAHDHLRAGCRAGLVGTNTIRQNYSREGGLDYIVANGGTITDAVSTQVWSGEAAVHVSLVNWIKGPFPGKKTLQRQLGDDRDSPWEKLQLDFINSSLSGQTDVVTAKRLTANANSGVCYQGQTHGHEGFLLTPKEARKLAKDKTSTQVIHPYLTADDLLSNTDSHPSRYSIDLNHCEDIAAASSHHLAFEQVRDLVLPTMKKNADEERQITKQDTGPRQNHLQKWWKFWRGRGECIALITKLPRYIVCGQVTKRPIFEFISPQIRPNAALIVFAVADDYSFGVLQSGMHWEWFKARCSTLKGDFRYTSDTVFDTFPWPQKPTLAQARAVAKVARELRELRRQTMDKNDWSLRELYRTLDLPGDNKLRDVQAALDTAVRVAYGMTAAEDVLAFLLKLNQQLAGQEARRQRITPPGLPTPFRKLQEFYTVDCVSCQTTA